MSKVTKKFLIRDYQARLGEHENAVVISVRGVKGIDATRMRLGLAQKQIRVTVLRNNLARHAFKDSGLQPLEKLFTGSSAVAYGGESVVDVARQIVDWAKKLEALELRGAVLDGELFEGKEGVERLSKFPTREEAAAKNVTIFLSPGRKLMGAVKGPGGRVMGIVKTIQTKLEAGETVSKIA